MRTYNILLTVFSLAAVLLIPQGKAAARDDYWDFDQNDIIANGEFIDKSSLDEAGILSFLQTKNSYLANYSDSGRTAARIIYDAAQNNNLNPKVIMATMQKEQSLITKTSYDANALQKAMGYGCPDSGSCDPAYASFPLQLDRGAWQLRYNFDRATTNVADYKVGQTMTIDSTAITFQNAATASLYRYTPHISGNRNFHTIYKSYFGFGWAVFAGQSGYPTLMPGQVSPVILGWRNTSNETWSSNPNGATPVRLGTSEPLDRVSRFRSGSSWASDNRINLSGDVSAGSTAYFTFLLGIPYQLPDGMAIGGDYKEYFRPVKDGVRWFEDKGVHMIVRIRDAHSAFAGQSAYPTIKKGQSATFTFWFKNTGQTVWTNWGPSAVHLGADNPRDRGCGFATPDSGNWINNQRVNLDQAEVVPGGIGSFTFILNAPTNLASGTYKEYFRPVAEGVNWMEDQGVHTIVTITD